MLVRFRASLFVTLLLVMVGAAVWLSSPKPLYDSDSVITIAVSQTPLSAPFIIAKELGYLDSETLRVDILPCYGGVKCAQLMFNGEVQYATASESVVMFSSFERNDFAVLASFVESDNDLKLLTLKENDIEQISQLDGKKVGVIKASSSEYYLDALIKSSVTPDIFIEKHYLPPNEMSIALLDHQVDAISIWEPYGYQLQNEKSHQIHDLSIRGIYHLSFNLMALKSTLESAPQENKQVLVALDRALEWMHEHPIETQKIVARYLDIPIGQLSWTWDDYAFRLVLSNSLLSNLQIQARWALENGLVAGEMPDYRKLIDRTQLWRAIQH
ncbi:TPA: ABC transporter substrate-binding protein [Vibrio vulnificus]|nr:ABC transporter substrate-binding protein [Vibrio vulnificus]